MDLTTKNYLLVFYVLKQSQKSLHLNYLISTLRRLVLFKSRALKIASPTARASAAAPKPSDLSLQFNCSHLSLTYCDYHPTWQHQSRFCLALSAKLHHLKSHPSSAFNTNHLTELLLNLFNNHACLFQCTI